MTLVDAPFLIPLKVMAFHSMTPEMCRILEQLGVDPGEEVVKKHSAPMGDPLALQIGEHLFTLRKEICSKIEVQL